MCGENAYRITLAGQMLELPLIAGEPSFYALDLSGKKEWNCQFARALGEQLHMAKVGAEAILTVEGKGIGLVEELANERYAIMRKTCPPYMQNSVQIERQASLTTPQPRIFYLGQDDALRLKGRKLLLVDDVLSTGGTVEAMLAMCELVKAQPVAIAVVLTEGKEWREYNGVKVFSLGHIPLAG